MGVIVYWLIVAAVLVLGQLIPQHGRRRKVYIGVMAVLHAFVCGCRYMHLTGDLQKYHFEFLNMMSYGYFSQEGIHGWKNTGFYWLMKFIADISNGDFQFFLILLAVVTEVIVAVLIFRYSPKPWFSYLVWNCMAFYVVYDFSTIKQGLAMAILMCAMICIFEKNFKGFLAFTLLAGFIHTPALCFLPAYWLAKCRINFKTILTYGIAAAVIFLFRNQIVDFVSQLYYEEEEFELISTELGGRFFMILLILLAGAVLKGFRERNFEYLFNIIVVAAVFQMFSGFDNVFSRLADYYLQFAVLFIPMVFYDAEREVPQNQIYSRPVLAFNDWSMKVLVAGVTVILIWYYYRTCLGVTISYAVDDYTNFRFMWDVR